MNWQLRITCQEKRPQPIRCPLDSLQEGFGAESYRGFLQNLESFREIDDLPLEVRVSWETTTEDLFKNRAVWHKSCRIKFSISKLERANKRKNVRAKSSDHPKRAKRCFSSNTARIFCGNGE